MERIEELHLKSELQSICNELAIIAKIVKTIAGQGIGAVEVRLMDLGGKELVKVRMELAKESVKE